MLRSFSFENFVWEFWTTFQDVPFSLGIFHWARFSGLGCKGLITVKLVIEGTK